MMDGPGRAGEPPVPRVRPFLRASGPGKSHPRSEAAPERAVRPFLVTAGRAVAASVLPVEAQIVATERGVHSVRWLAFEYRELVAVCVRPVAVAEAAARLALHLGVVRVLVTDLQQQGMINIYHSNDDIDADTILRVIHGLRQRI